MLVSLAIRILVKCQRFHLRVEQLFKFFWKMRSFLHKGLVKKYRGGGVGRSREGVGHEVLSLVQGVGRAIFSYP